MDTPLQVLIKRVPRIFKGKEPENMSSHNPLPSGWLDLAEILYQEIDQHLDEDQASRIEINTFGDRQGGLALSWSLHNFTLPQDEDLKVKVRPSIDAACSRAESTCAECGKRVLLAVPADVLPLCDEHPGSAGSGP